MNTTTLRRLLGETTARPLEGLRTAHAELIVELVNNADELLAESERLRAALQDVLAEFAIGGCAPDASSNCRTCRALVAPTRALEQKP